MIQAERIKPLNNKSVKSGRYVLYWMQAAQRSQYNHALELAVGKANEFHKPVVAVFGLTDDYPEANLRHYHFMLEGLLQTQKELRERGVQMVVRHKSPDEAAVELSENACMVIVDAGQLRIQRKWRRSAAKKINCEVLEVETNLIVPVEEASGKEEFAARTIRAKIHNKLAKYLIKVTHKKPKADSLGFRFDSFDISDIEKALSKLKIDRSVGKVDGFAGGTNEAKKLLRHFIKHKLDKYD